MNQVVNQNVALTQLMEQLSRSEHRLLKLENDVTETEILVKKSSLSQDGVYASLDDKFSLIAHELSGIKDDLELFTKYSGSVMLRFHDIIKQEQINELNDRLNNWPLEFFMRRDDFRALVKKSFTELL